MDDFRMDPARRRNRRRPLRQTPGVMSRPFRERRPSDTLPEMEVFSGRVLRGDQRCGVLGLPLGDCEQEHIPGSAYCFYHDKLQKGLTEATARTYPVWPLPLNGYIFTDEARQVAA